MVLPEKASDRVCHRLVPIAAVVPCASVVAPPPVSVRRTDQAPVSLTRRW